VKRRWNVSDEIEKGERTTRLTIPSDEPHEGVELSNSVLRIEENTKVSQIFRREGGRRDID